MAAVTADVVTVRCTSCGTSCDVSLDHCQCPPAKRCRPQEVAWYKYGMMTWYVSKPSSYCSECISKYNYEVRAQNRAQSLDKWPGQICQRLLDSAVLATSAGTTVVATLPPAPPAGPAPAGASAAPPPPPAAPPPPGLSFSAQPAIANHPANPRHQSVPASSVTPAISYSSLQATALDHRLTLEAVTAFQSTLDKLLVNSIKMQTQLDEITITLDEIRIAVTEIKSRQGAAAAEATRTEEAQQSSGLMRYRGGFHIMSIGFQGVRRE